LDEQVETEISVIVVNYGTAELARAAVDSVLARTHGGRKVDIHLVDNASPGRDREILAEAARSEAWRGRVTFYPEQTNHGFARAHNLVFRALAARAHPPDKVFLLNPDAQLENEAIAILADTLDADPGLAMAGAGITEPSIGPAVAAFRFPGAASEFAHFIGFGPVYRLFERARVPLPPDHPEGPVDWVTGAAFMARFGVLRDLDWFDPAFFLYFEETDLMRRARAAGWQIRYVPRARVLHLEGVATGIKSGEDQQRRRRGAYWYRSWAHYFRKAKGRAGALGIALAVLLAGLVHYPLAALRRRPPALPRRFLPDFLVHAMLPLLFGRSPPADTAAAPAPRGATNRNPADIGFWALVAEDFRTHERDPLSQGFWALFWHRFGNWRMGVRPRALRIPLSLVYFTMYRLGQRTGGIMLPYSVPVGRRVKLEHFGGMILSAHEIGNDVIIRQNTTFGIAGLDDLEGRPTIGDGVEIGAGAVVIGNIHVGAGAIIGANAVVAKPVPPGTVVGGVPARIIRMRDG